MLCSFIIITNYAKHIMIIYLSHQSCNSIISRSSLLSIIYISCHIYISFISVFHVTHIISYQVISSYIHLVNHIIISILYNMSWSCISFIHINHIILIHHCHSCITEHICLSFHSCKPYQVISCSSYQSCNHIVFIFLSIM